MDGSWTIDTLKEHFGALVAGVVELIGNNDRRYEQRFAAQEQAVTAAAMLRIPIEVVSRLPEQVGIIPDRAEHKVAMMTEQTTHSTGYVTMVNRETPDRAAAAPARFRSLANRANPLLVCEHFVILVYGYTVVVSEAVGANVFRVVLRDIAGVLALLIVPSHVARFALAFDAIEAIRGGIEVRDGLGFAAYRTALSLAWRNFRLYFKKILLPFQLGTRFAPGAASVSTVFRSSIEVVKGFGFVAEGALFLRYNRHVGTPIQYRPGHGR